LCWPAVGLDLLSGDMEHEGRCRAVQARAGRELLALVSGRGRGRGKVRVGVRVRVRVEW
jgi:hypothetical protein